MKSFAMNFFAQTSKFHKFSSKANDIPLERWKTKGVRLEM